MSKSEEVKDLKVNKMPTIQVSRPFSTIKETVNITDLAKFHVNSTGVDVDMMITESGTVGIETKKEVDGEMLTLQGISFSFEAFVMMNQVFGQFIERDENVQKLLDSLEEHAVISMINKG